MTVLTFVRYNLKVMGMFMVYCHIKYHISSYSGSLLITTKHEAKYTFHMAAMLFWVALHRELLYKFIIFHHNENMAKLKFLEMTVTYWSVVHDKIKSRL